MSKEIKPNEILILWGKNPDEGSKPTRYTFKTNSEIDAFLLGITEMNGSQDYKKYNSGSSKNNHRQKIIDKCQIAASIFIQNTMFRVNRFDEEHSLLFVTNDHNREVSTFSIDEDIFHDATFYTLSAI